MKKKEREGVESLVTDRERRGKNKKAHTTSALTLDGKIYFVHS